MKDQLFCVLRLFLSALVLGASTGGPTRSALASDRPDIEAGFHLLYELKFPEARARFSAWEKVHPDDPLGSTSEAASYLFEEFYAQGVLTSEFFLDDKLLLGGPSGKNNEARRATFLAANQRAQDLARRLLKSDPRDMGALFALTLSTGMQADFAGLIEKRQLESLYFVRRAQSYARDLLARSPDSGDAYLTLGAANYIIGCLPAHKRFFLWFGGVHGDRLKGMQQLEITAIRGHYLRPFAKILLALAALREKRVELARAQLVQLVDEFPQNPLFLTELSKLNKISSPGPTMPCPECGSRSKQVETLTVKSFVRRLPFGMVPAQYYYCEETRSDLVYFLSDARDPCFSSGRPAGASTIEREGRTGARLLLLRRQTPGYSRFEVQRTGKSTITERVTAEVKAGNCACEVKSPSCKCCLGDVIHTAQTALQTAQVGNFFSIST